MMNKNNIAYQSQQSLALKEFVQISKVNSKDKFTNLRKYSKSPLHSEESIKTQSKLQVEQLKKIQQRYRQLEDKYHDLLDKTKTRNWQHQKLKSQLRNYQKMHDRSTEEIQRLRCIIGLIKRKTVSTQVQEDQLDSSNGFRVSRMNKFDQSTEDQIKLKSSGEKFNSRDKLSHYKRSEDKNEEQFNVRSSGKNISIGGLYAKNKSKYNNISAGYNPISTKGESPTQYCRQMTNGTTASRISKRLSNSPYSKYRFIPGAALK